MDALELLASIRQQREELNRREKVMVATLHDAGISYDEIGKALGVSRQRAQHIGAENGSVQRIRNGPQYEKKGEEDGQ